MSCDLVICKDIVDNNIILFKNEWKKENRLPWEILKFNYLNINILDPQKSIT